MIKVLTISGTRPEAIKIAPVIQELKKHPGSIQTINCSTGQHRELLQGIFDLFNIELDYNLDLMTKDQTLFQITSRLFQGLSEVFEKEKPDWVLAQGDTTTVMVASILSYYGKIKFGHIEAGLRTNDLYSPYPEEGNRIIADSVAHKMWAPTQTSALNLINSGISKENVIVTGNTVIDSLRIASEKTYDIENADFKRYSDQKIVLITAHRRESFGTEMDNIYNAIKTLALKYEDLVFVYPVHFNPNVKDLAKKVLGNIPNIELIEPINYLPFIHLMKKSYLILTDSGGLQEEAPFFNVPVLVMRNTTERPEGIEAGVSVLLGTTRENIVKITSEVLDNRDIYSKMANAKNPYGDGYASEKIVASILEDQNES